MFHMKLTMVQWGHLRPLLRAPWEGRSLHGQTLQSCGSTKANAENVLTLSFTGLKWPRAFESGYVPSRLHLRTPRGQIRQEERMTKADLVDEIAERTGLTKKDVADTVDEFLQAVSRALATGKHIEIRGFGTFKVKDRKSRLARNPRTGESVPVPPRRVPVFKVSKELKDIVAQI
ncbi:MAG TPA: HU family DNA-binding protein [Candidatus Eisenbacteria bacterium]|nr:HU family DNA-binding protein [Candidatus Eisenbacteria bacterium]